MDRKPLQRLGLFLLASFLLVLSPLHASGQGAGREQKAGKSQSIGSNQGARRNAGANGSDPGKGRLVRLTISSDPADCKVFINGRVRGETNSQGHLAIDLLPGRQRIRLFREGYHDQEQTIDLLVAQAEPFVLAPILVQLNVTTNPPEAEVYLDGEYKGVSRPDGSLLIQQVKAGSHKLRAQRKGYFPQEQSVRVLSAGGPLRIKLAPDPVSQFVRVIEQHVAAGRLAEALVIYRRLAVEKSNHPDLPGVLETIARALLDKDLDLLNHPGASGLAVSLKQAEEKRGLYDQVRKWRQNDANLDGLAEYWAVKYYSAKAQQAASKAERDGLMQNQQIAMARVSALNPRIAAIAYDLGWCYLELNDRGGAKKNFAQARDLNVNWAFPHYALGKLQIDEAEQEVDKKIRRGKYNSAVTELDQAIKLNSNFVPAYADRAMAYAKLGKNKEALASAQEAVVLKPESAYAHYTLGFAYYQKGKSYFPNARRELETAISLKSDELEKDMKSQAQQLLAETSNTRK